MKASILKSCLMNVFYRSGKKISIERLQNFQEYQEKTPLWWCALMIICTPLPSFLIVGALNYIPFASPEASWDQHGNFYLVQTFTCISAGIAILLQTNYFIQGQYTKPWQLGVTVTSGTIVYMGVTMFLAAYYTFPSPFGLVLPLIPTIPFAICICYLTYRWSKDTISTSMGAVRPQEIACNHKKEVLESFKKYAMILLFQWSLFIIYPPFVIGFKLLPKDHMIWQLIYMRLFPLVKLFLMRIITHLTSHLEDLVIETMVFSVDLFSALFLSMCLGSGVSLQTTIISMTMDYVYIMYKMRQFVHHSSTLIESLNQRYSSTLTMVSEVLKMTQAHRQLIQQQHPELRLQTSNGLAFKRAKKLDHILRPRSTKTLPKPKVAMTMIVPVGTTTTTTSTFKLAQEKEIEFMGQVLLFFAEMEYLTLVEYVEAFIPFMYMLYLLSAYNCPNMRYVASVQYDTPEDFQAALMNMMLYASLEILSLIVLYTYVKYKFGINVFMLLAFVLETHFTSIQGKLYMFLCVCMHFDIVHYGMDFTFQFTFMKDRSQLPKM